MPCGRARSNQAKGPGNVTHTQNGIHRSSESRYSDEFRTQQEKKNKSKDQVPGNPPAEILNNLSSHGAIGMCVFDRRGGQSISFSKTDCINSILDPNSSDRRGSNRL